MLERHLNAEFANQVLNDASVRPDIADAAEGHVDISAQVANLDNVLLCGEHGGFMYFRLLGGCYEVHSFVLRSGRGRWALAAALSSIDWIFTKTDAYEITTRIPAGHLAAEGLATKCGLRHEFSEPIGCKWRGAYVTANIWGIRIQDWITKAPHFEELGRKFHVKLGCEADAAGITELAHPDAPCHNRYVGAALAMIEAGQFIKAVSFYNRWALCARHRPIMPICEDPPEIAMDAGILRFSGTDFELVKPS